MVMCLAVGQAVVLEKVSTGEGLLAGGAHEACGVPLPIQGTDVTVLDGLGAAPALGREYAEEARLAEGLTVAVVEAVLAEWLAAVGAGEALGVPGGVQGGDALVQDGFLAASASRGEETVVVCLAVGSAVAFEKVLGAEFLVAMGAGEVLKREGNHF